MPGWDFCFEDGMESSHFYATCICTLHTGIRVAYMVLVHRWTRYIVSSQKMGYLQILLKTVVCCSATILYCVNSLRNEPRKR
jgi:hypothetical protein